MQRQYPGMDGFRGGTSKIRKRISSSSSSVSASSSLMQNDHFKKAIMVGRRGGSTTPTPNWRVNPRSPAVSSKISESSRQQGPVSARKLANALWELNKIPLPRFIESLPTRRSRKIPKSIPRRLSDPSHSPVSERSDRSRSSRRLMSIISQRIWSDERRHRALDLFSNASLMEIDARSQSLSTSSTFRTKNCLKDLRNSLTASKDLLKLLIRLWGQEDQQSYSLSLISDLRDELNQAGFQVDQLIQEQNIDHNEINFLKKRFMEEKSSWKIKQRERSKLAVQLTMGELESEKRLRRRAEWLNKKLGLELADTTATLSKAVEELENERRSREIIEQICNEVVRSIGDNREEVEHLKKESAVVREEIEKEREMLQRAHEWREARVQMKLLEAKVQFEEKNAAVDMLRNELESFLETKRSKEKLAEQRREREDDDDDDDERESVESDLHSIELNMESNKGRSYDEKIVGLVGEKERRSLENNSQEENEEEIDEDQRYESVKELRKCLISGTKIVLPRSLVSPIRESNRNQAFEEKGDRVYEGLNVSEIIKAIREGASGSKGRLSLS